MQPWWAKKTTTNHTHYIYTHTQRLKDSLRYEDMKTEHDLNVIFCKNMGL